MNSYEFRLTPAYCLYNGIAVMKQNGADICFITENLEDNLLKERVIKAFNNFLSYVLRQQNCPQEFKKTPVVSFAGCTRAELKKYVSKMYSNTETLNSHEKKDLPASKKEAESAAVLLLDSIMEEARNRNATDIHIEKNTIRFRIYGRLEPFLQLTSEKSHELIQRIKYLAGMNVLENRRSQDGHFVYGTTNPVFVRVSAVGIIGGNNFEAEESVVIRLLDTKRLPLLLNQLGFNKSQFTKIRTICENPNGLVIICGPTGSGKSTTAASVLVDLERRKQNTKKIVSLEDPPEYLIPGVTQIKIDEKVNNSFSNALAHVFRQDPDILMIGEIRDEKSAAAAIRASLTGHLVIATLHASTAAGAILRLENLGLSRKLIISALKGVIVQSLYTIKNKVILLADVSVPLEALNQNHSLELTEQELEELFEHNTNYSDVINNTIIALKQAHAPDSLIESSLESSAENSIENSPDKIQETVFEKMPVAKHKKTPLVITNKINRYEKQKEEAV